MKNKDEEFILPEKWYIRVTEDNKSIINSWKIKQTYDDDLYEYNYNYVHDNGAGSINKEFNYKEITIEQFKQYVLKEDTMEKKLIGYKLIKPEYAEAVLKIEGGYCIGTAIKTDQILYSKHEKSVDKLKNAGVLDLWFEPVYKEEIKTIRMGGSEGFDLTIKNNKVFHKSEDITNFVKEIYERFSVLSKKTIAGYDFHSKDVILSKTGCENKETKLSEWLALYDMIKLILFKTAWNNTQ